MSFPSRSRGGAPPPCAGFFLAAASVKRLLFGAAAGTITELYADQQRLPARRSSLCCLAADKLTRQRLTNAAKAACAIVIYPAALAMLTRYRLAGHCAGDCLYTLARRA